MPRRSKHLAVSAVLLLLFSNPDVARPCGGFFCFSVPMDQVSERILFVVDEGAITTHVQIEYNGTADEFAWVLPVPSLPDLQVSHNEIFRQLQFATQPSFLLEWQDSQTCGLFAPPFFRAVDEEAAADDGVEVIATERVGPYDTAIITADDPDAITQWLQANGYDLDDLGSQLLRPYVEEGFFFVALKLAPDRDIGDLQPIALTYQADKPGIPIRLTAIATQPDLGVLVWVLGQHRAIPQNYLHVQINQARIDWFNGGINYEQVVTEAADEADGQAFVTEYAGATGIMGQRLYREGQYDLDRLRLIGDPTAFIDALLRQGFPRDTQMQSLLRRHIPMPAAVLEKGILEVVFGGNREAYDLAREEGRLQALAENSFYGNINAFEAYTGDLEFDAQALTDDLETIIVEPLRAAQALFGDFPYMTRLFTTLSAAEMTLDPIFSFNPDLPKVDNMHTARAHWECPVEDPEKINFEELVLVVTLEDGRQIRSTPLADGQLPEPIALQPAAALVERLDESGPPETIRSMTAILSGTAVQQTAPEDFALLPNYPNPFNSGTILSVRVPALTDPLQPVALRLYNLLGQPVRTLLREPLTQGLYRIEWDGLDSDRRPAPSGVYFLRLEAGSTQLNRKLLLLR